MVPTVALQLVLGLALALGSALPPPQAAPSTRSPHGPQFNIPCQNCHTFSGWKPIRSAPEFDHNKTSYPLRGLHKNVACQQCHTSPVFSTVGTKCADCHADIHRRQMGAQCEQCHSVNGWMVSLKSVREHQNRFPLLGAHAVTDCDSCHKGAAAGRFQGLSTDCVSCHVTSYLKTNSPSHVTLSFPTQCQQCHSNMDSWAGARFDHATITGFALTGAHATLDCSSCHVGGRFQGTPSNCVGCHTKDFNAAKDPDHLKLGFPQNCSQCHSTTTWMGAKFDHASTGFVLTGSHATLSCSSCHTGGQLTAANTTCVSCHLKDFNSTGNPNHAAVGFSQQCNTCHSTTTWLDAKFDHASTGFVLAGAHATLNCSSCHAGGQLSAANTTCVSCHLKDFNGATNPNHVAGGFSQQCNTCHSMTAWQPASFDHNKTGFPLTGAHTSVACSQCHVNGQYAGTSTACVSCHLTTFQKTTNPNHVMLGFPQTCNTCHSTTAWQPASFDHSKTSFPLTGAHTSVACSQCHVNGQFAGTSTACVSCHLTNFQKTTNPNHVMLGFPQTCNTCHSTTAWQPASFDHSKTGFPLTGAHATVTCTQCHVGGKYSGTSSACSSCHLADYQKTTNPNHVAVAFPTNCSQCHTTTSWAGAIFDHSNTGFTLSGAHATLACSSCHAGTPLTTANAACSSCHLKTYQQTTNPNHASVGFPTDCSLCHSTTNWLGAQFDHATTGFALTGAHATLNCSACHTGSTLTAASTACVSCHLKDYTGATNPNHVSLAFPQQCNICHSTAAWQPASFDHSQTAFPLTGAHTAVACANCHIGGKYAGTPTDCYSCHKAEYQSVTNPNHVAAGFPTTCQMCHTTTSWAGATFNHTWFPIPHKTARLCSDCHTNSSNYSIFVCTNCHTQAQTNAQHTGVKNYVWNSTNCYSCHRNGGGG